MINRMILSLVVIVSITACEPKKPEAVSVEFNQLKNEVIEVHDIAMEQMSDIMKLKKTLKSQLDSADLDSTLVLAITDLDIAHDGMMVWMRGFSDSFTGDILANGLPDSFDSEEQRKDAETYLVKMKAQEESVKTMAETIQLSIDQAQALVTEE